MKKKKNQLGRIVVGVALLSSACAGTGEIQTGQAEVEVSVIDGSTIPEQSEAEQPADQEGGESGSASDDGNDAAAPAATPAGSPGAPAVDCDGGSPSTYQPEAPTSPATPESIALNQPVTGEIEQFTVDNWKLDLCAGQIVFFDSLDQCSGSESLDWYFISPDGEDQEYLGRLIDTAGNCGGDGGSREIIESGQYTVEVAYSGAADDSGSYSMQVLSVPPPDTFDVAIGTTIAPGSPEGAGSIEAIGANDHYLLTLEAGQRIFFDVAEACDGPGPLDWYLIDPAGDETYISRLIDTADNCTDDPDPITVGDAGTYTIRVGYADNDDTSGGTYGFTIVDASGGG